MKSNKKDVDSAVGMAFEMSMKFVTMAIELMEMDVLVLVRSKQGMNAYNFLQFAI